MNLKITDCKFIRCRLDVPDLDEIDSPVVSVTIHEELFVDREFSQEDFMRALAPCTGPDARLGPCRECGRLAAYSSPGAALCADKDMCAVAFVMES